ncbi:MAG TPA: peptidoglycan bridge formation glycyltransferase FemA/FemB family protein [Candidatus Dormibacteraeota bacterium]|nr:peptidoglycan bridge formation glycyltransferase FemA/FemB family protein [Candidatus Dormibacteraeota bacterium]
MPPIPASVRVRPATEADRAAWDHFALHEAGGNLLQTWGWAELKREFGWGVDRWVVERSENGGIEGVLHMLTRRGGGGISFAYAPRGPALRDCAAGADAGLALIATARMAARRRRALVLKLDPEWGIDDPGARRLGHAAHLRDSPYDVQHRLTWLVPLDGGEEAVLARIKASTRHHIRKAQRDGVSVEVRSDPDAVDVFHPLFEETVQRSGFVGRGLDYHRAVVRHLGGSTPTVTLLASVEGEAVAGMIAVAAGPRLVYLFGGSSLRHARHQPAYLMHWEAIRWGLAHGCSVYDMWGVPNHEDPTAEGAGYYEFKRRWNGEVARHIRCQDVPLWPAFGPLPRLAERVALRGRPLLT